ncbi:SUR7/PalI family-domain-containing protein [Microdochium trichocladiopsis]|uniref:SUR7/PalI family-domain-containing protein n=1 Tax=Microdochium trichocladiopsis TaxID=1682393 RepID=A0A9P8YEP1_9PEZI|nr:SUR7/PalI family-domain-containing protein [Microdochium trichocladiopsis]KAH7035628.1 SUR7/PalI family-domain-containing protein [Microdochium trichocladiopsis]
MMARLPWYGIFFAIVSAVFSLLVVLSGVAGSAPLFFLQFNTSNYRGPPSGSQLGTSQFLQGLTTVSGNDLVGSGSGQNAHFAQRYQVTLLSVCQTDNGRTTCSPPKFGYTFDVQQAFQLRDDMFGGVDMTSFWRQTAAYRPVSLFLAIAYVLGTVFTLVSLVMMFLTACVPKGASLVACFTQTLAAVLLLAASIASAVTFYRLGDTYNATLGRVGIQTAVSWRIMVISFLAAVESWLVLIFLLGLRKSIKRRSNAAARSMAASSPKSIGNTTKVFVAGSGQASPSVMSGGAARSGYRGTSTFGGLLQKMPTWKGNQQKYTEINRQSGAMAQTSAYNNSPRGGLMAANEEEDFSHGMPDDVSQGAMGYNQRDPAARYDDPSASQATKTGLHAETAYDPYRK